MDPRHEREQLDHVIERLSLRFSDLPVAAVHAAVGQAEAGMRSARIREYVPVLVEKEARDRLRSRFVPRWYFVSGSVQPDDRHVVEPAAGPPQRHH